MKKRRGKHIIKLSNQQKQELKEITRKGKHSVRVIKRAHVLLKSEQGITDEEIALQTEIATSSIERIRYRFCEGGIKRALYDNPRSGQPVKLSSKIEAYLVAIACSNPPDGNHHWTLEMLQKKLIKDKKIKSISTVAIWGHLKKRGIKPWLEKNVVYSKSNTRVRRKDGGCS